MDKVFGDIVRKSRIKNKWTMTQFIKQLDFEISSPYLLNIELKGEIPEPFKICRIAEVLKIEPKKLLEIALQQRSKLYTDSLRKRYFATLEAYKESRNNSSTHKESNGTE